MIPWTARARHRLRWLFPTMRNVLVRRALHAIEFGDVGSVLVVGAGEDPYRHLFPQAATYIRSDLVPRTDRTDIVADAAALPFRDGCFQCAVATEVLEYIRQPHEFAKELYRVLSSSGLAVITTPFVFQEHGDYWRPTRRALEELFRQYSEVRIRAQGNRLHTIVDLLTTTFSPYPVLFPLRVLSNLLFLVPASITVRDARSTAPTGFLVVATK
jgi:SAM-dependent methyltransferase